MNPFANIGAIAAAVMPGGQLIEFTLHTGEVMKLRAIYKANHVEIKIGDYGAEIRDEYPIVDIVRSDWPTETRTVNDLYDATFEINGEAFRLDAPVDNGVSMIRCQCNSTTLD